MFVFLWVNLYFVLNKRLIKFFVLLECCVLLIKFLVKYLMIIIFFIFEYLSIGKGK